MTYGAIYHASLVPDDAWVERIIDQNYMEIFQRKDSASIRQWTGELGQQLIFRRPRLAIHEANSRAWFGQLEEAGQLLEEAEKMLQAEPSSPETQAMFGYLAYIKSRVTAMRGNFEQAITLCLSARENTPESNPGLLGGIGVMLGYGYFLHGDFASAEQTFLETIRAGKKSGAINTTIGAYCVLARLYALQGRLQKSVDLYREAESFIHKSEEQLPGAMSIVQVGLAETLYEMNDLEAARAHIQQGMESLPLWSKADDTALAHVIYAKIEQVQGNMPAAVANIEKASQTVHSSGVFSEARDAVTAAEIALQFENADTLTLHRRAAGIETRLTSERPFRFENELLLITLARLYMAQAAWDKAVTLLAQLEESAHAGGRDGRQIKILLLQALALHNRGEQDRAFAVLGRALALAEPEGYVRTFLDEGPPLQRLLTQWVSQAQASPVRAYARHLLSQFDADAQPDREGQPTGKGSLIEPLTPREIEVLIHIAAGKTNKEISAELVVSPGTVKAHTSSIYRKLDVSNRTEAVVRARQLKILS
jgi:LuxR family maltose regulon positive regulatory protein